MRRCMGLSIWSLLALATSLSICNQDSQVLAQARGDNAHEADLPSERQAVNGALVCSRCLSAGLLHTVERRAMQGGCGYECALAFLLIAGRDVMVVSAFVLSSKLAASAWQTHALQMVRPLVRVAGAAQVLSQAMRAAGQRRGTHETRASTHHGPALALGRIAAIASRGRF